MAESLILFFVELRL